MLKPSNSGRAFRFFPAALFFFFLSLPAWGGIVFSDLDLSGDNQLLFRAGSGDAVVQDALFVTSLPVPAGGQALAVGQVFAEGQALAPQQLTAFPEKMDLLENGRVLQIRNAFGVQRVSLPAGLPMPVPGLPSFPAGTTAGMAAGRAGEMAASADGRWLLYLDPVSPALGNLVLVDVYTGAKTLVASRLDRPEKTFPAAWSPDSRLFVYQREGKLYFYLADSSAVPAAMPGNEKNRCIGEGTMNSVSWGRGGDFYYLSGSTLYQVKGTELFIRAMYADFLSIGVVAGKIPCEFDPAFDSFWVAPDGRSLLVSKGRRSLLYYPLETGTAAGSALMVLPSLLIPRSCSELHVLWSAGGVVTVLVSIPAQTGTELRVWRLDLSGGNGAAFIPLQPPGPGKGSGSFSSGLLSPDGSLALFWGNGGILLYDYTNWKLLEVLSVRSGIACLWAGNDGIITGDSERIEQIKLTLSPGAASGAPRAVLAKRDLVCLSRSPQAGFEETSFRILAKSGDTWFVTDRRNPWTQVSVPRLRIPSQVSGRYRVYLEKQKAGFYANVPMIRNTASAGTFSLFPVLSDPGSSNPAAPVRGEPPYTPGGVFSSGVRTGPKEAALCFDLYDDDEGLPETLAALKNRGIKATFFLNGEFIRRHPLAVQDIAAAGHEAASMFFALINFADARYRTGSDFVSRGLARNEDEFFRVTGKELALLWHPPWYMVSGDIAGAAAAAGYVTTGRDLDPQDWVTADDEKMLGLPRRSSSEMIDRIMEKVRPGSIIPVRLGILPGSRNDYLFSRINVLIDALAGESYTLTTVSTILEHTKP